MLKIISFLCLIIAVTIHELSHAFTADRLGDPTPRSQGRISLNPLAHLDLLGTIMIFFAGFGWGKPVIIDPYNFASPRRDELLTALAGPASNLILALVSAILLKIFGGIPLLSVFFYILLLTNLTLAIFNLLPFPPLDGSKIFLNLLPLNRAVAWQQAFDQYGYFILALLIFLPISGSNLVSLIINPIINFFAKFLLSL